DSCSLFVPGRRVVVQHKAQTKSKLGTRATTTKALGMRVNCTSRKKTSHSSRQRDANLTERDAEAIQYIKSTVERVKPLIFDNFDTSILEYPTGHLLIPLNTHTRWLTKRSHGRSLFLRARIAKHGSADIWLSLEARAFTM